MEPTQTPRHSVSVAGVILSGDASHVLLVKRRDNGRWEPPGGVLELDETITDGLVREVREEAGVEVEVGALTGVYKNLPAGIVALVYRCSTRQVPLLETPEAAEVRWQPTGSLRALMSPAFAVRVEDALTPGPPNTRAHDGFDMLDGLNDSGVS